MTNITLYVRAASMQNGQSVWAVVLPTRKLMATVRGNKVVAEYTGIINALWKLPVGSTVSLRTASPELVRVLREKSTSHRLAVELLTTIKSQQLRISTVLVNSGNADATDHGLVKAVNQYVAKENRKSVVKQHVSRETRVAASQALRQPVRKRRIKNEVLVTGVDDWDAKPMRKLILSPSTPGKPVMCPSCNTPRTGPDGSYCACSR